MFRHQIEGRTHQQILTALEYQKRYTIQSTTLIGHALCVFSAEKLAKTSGITALGEKMINIIIIKKHYEQNPNPDSCICKAHLIEARRMWAIADYTPKWKTSHGTLINTCIVADYQSNTKLVAPKFDSIENIEANIGVKSPPENPLLLSAKHYIAVYRQLNLTRPCANCGAIPKQDLLCTSFTKCQFSL